MLIVVWGICAGQGMERSRCTWLNSRHLGHCTNAIMLSMLSMKQKLFQVRLGAEPEVSTE